jgi:hypothetical protein
VPSLDLLVELSRKLSATPDCLLTGREITPLDATGEIRSVATSTRRLRPSL